MNFQIPEYFTKANTKRDILILLFLASLVVFINLGSGSLSSWDEAFYGQVSREMFQSSNWVDLTWGGEAWADKPPLYMWGTACFYKLFGVSEFSTRLFSGIAGIILIILIYLFARRLFSARVGMVSAIMALSTYHLLWFSRMGTLDVTFTLFLTLAIYCFIRSRENPAYIIFSFAWFGYAFLTKGVGALLIPIILVLYVALSGRWKMMFNKYTLPGVLIFLVITGSWYIPAYLRYGQLFLHGQFFQHIVSRTGQAMDGHQGSWITYINVVLYKGKPWGAAGLIALPFLIFWTARKKQSENYILVSWILVTLLIFSAIRTKLHWYIMPVYPAVMIVAAWGIDKLLRRYVLYVVLAVAIGSVLYFGIKKDIFYLDDNPGIKSLSEEVNEGLPDTGTVYLYGISDPGVKFYFGERGKNIHNAEDMDLVQLEEGDVIVTRTENIPEFKKKGDVVTDEASGLTTIRIK